VLAKVALFAGGVKVEERTERGALLVVLRGMASFTK
jgi:hypothetical protein